MSITQLEKAIEYQRTKVLALARKLNSSFTEEDILQPFDHPILQKDVYWNYEDGILAGLLMAKTILLMPEVERSF